MAKMFYTLDETAERLGVSADHVKQLAAGGKLQQFRDREKLMFKRDQVETLAAQGVGEATSQASGGPLPLAGAPDKVDLAGEHKTPPGRKEDPRQATGVSVFDAEEIEPADPMAQTQITKGSAADELSLESVGSGSGLLDLTRESDDTSLGAAELLDEIVPTEGSDAKVDAGSGGPVLETALHREASAASGLEALQPSAVAAIPVTMALGEEEAYDPAGSGMSFGFLFGAAVVLVVLMIVALSAVVQVPSALTRALAGDSTTLALYAGGAVVVSVVLGVIGFFVGKSRA